jgi:hypothetical protein
VNESVRTLAQFLGFSLSGALINFLGAPIACIGCLCAFLMLAVHCLLLPSSRAEPGSPKNSYSQLIRLYYYQSTYGTDKRARLSIGLSLAGGLSFAAPQNLFILYLISEPYNFDAYLIGAFLGYKTLALSVICLVYAVIPSARTKTIKDTHMIAAGLFLLASSYLVFIISTRTLTLFIGATLYGMFGLAAVSFNSLLSKAVSEGELAHTFAITTGFERVLLCIITPAVGVTFQQTKTWPLHGLCFVIPLILTFISGIILTVYWKQFSYQTISDSDEILPLKDNSFRTYKSCSVLPIKQNLLPDDS